MNGDEYVFLTDDEQDVNREIKNILLESSEVIAKIGEVIFEDIYQEKKFKYNSKNDFAFDQQIDDHPRGIQDGEIGLRIITPFYDNYSEYGEQEFYAMSFGGKSVILRLPSDASFWYEMEEVIKIETYRTKTASVSLPENIRTIIDNKSREQKTRKERVKSLLTTAIAEGEIYYNAQKLEIKSSQPVEKINKAFQIMVEDIYSKLNYVQKFAASNSDIYEILTDYEGQIELVMDEPNQLALDELNDYIGKCHDRNIRVTMKMLLGHFKAAPYGWKEIDIAALIARLFKLQEIKLQYGAEYLGVTDKEIPNYLTKRTEVEKLVITKRVLVSADLLIIARNIGRNVFEHSALPQDEDGLMRQFKDLIRREINEINTAMSNYRHGAYPGEAALESTCEILKKIARIRVAEEFFISLLENEAALCSAMQEVKKVKGFFKNQLPHFDKAVKMLNIFKDNETYVLDKEINETVSKVRAIVHNPNPYAEIINLPGLVAKFNERFAQLLQEKCQPIKAQIQADFAQVKEELRKQDLESNFIEEIRKPFEDLLERIDTVNNFFKAIAMQTESEILKIRCFDEIAEALRPVYPPVPEPPIEEGEKIIPPVVEKSPSRFTQHLNVAELVRTAPLMTNEAEVDRFIGEFRNKLKGYIRENKNVRLV